MPGSPPHTRGKVGHHFFDAHPTRITPAHAGKSSLSALGLCRRRDHPRTRGEKEMVNANMPTAMGSPPHTRGKEEAAKVSKQYKGITPAHAGKSSVWRAAKAVQRDHPRTRGEKPSCPSTNSAIPGSPPHTRGKGRDLPARGKRGRITPAHAGKREILVILAVLSKDHPRTRGEKKSG